ncbi:hypothetical protein BN1012_Phect193 [Candidatus Phaeomarinobacter ectocarpi]|uniref:GYF domain-containing protein n=1 Tax=Candidatus Phaeomarinibacter ectocarpi TaxID=1458461 RepID=X5MBQ5_9HYPH|nr:hypothetical protein [Candidatus Phaeomarinobacter ectocarpi]CDO58407.1 hypothetical protein BN1012_Phect193 [Candidatus Phaeomarinobacter ectocarpi]
MTDAPHSPGDASLDDPFDGRWVLQVSGRIYGPYTGHALRDYVREGRVVAHSMLARTGQPAGEEEWMPAAQDPVLSQLFSAADTELLQVRQEMDTPSPSGGGPQGFGSKKTQTDRRDQPTSFNIVIITDVKSRSSGPLENALMSLGPAYKISANVWVVHTPSGAPEVVNLLTQHLGGSDRLFVVDATRNRTAWFNMGPETDAKIRQVWKQDK